MPGLLDTMSINTSLKSRYEQLMFADFPTAAKTDLNPTEEAQDVYVLSLAHKLSVKSINSYYDVSSSFEHNDMVSLNFLVQSSISDSKGFRLYSEDEIQTKKHTLIVNKARLKDIRLRLSLQKRMNDAASSIRSLNGQNDIFNDHFLYQQTSEALDNSSKRLKELQIEHDELLQTVHFSEIEILQHSVAVLALSHPGSKSIESQAYLDSSLNSTGKTLLHASPFITRNPMSLKSKPQESDINDDLNSNTTLKDSTDLTRETSVSGVGSNSKFNLFNNKPLGSESLQDEMLESLIMTVSSVLPHVESPGPLPSTREKLEHLESVTRSLVREYISIDNSRHDKEEELDKLKQSVCVAISELDNKSTLEFSAISAKELSDSLISVLNNYKNRLENLQTQQSTLGESEDKLEILYAERDQLKESLKEMNKITEERDELQKASINFQPILIERDELKTSISQMESQQKDLVMLEGTRTQLAEIEKERDELLKEVSRLQSENSTNSSATSFPNTRSVENENSVVKAGVAGGIISAAMQSTSSKNISEIESSLDESNRQVQNLQESLSKSESEIEEWKAKTSTIKAELETVLGSLEELTRQTVAYESERTKMEAQINELQAQMRLSSSSSSLSILTKETQFAPDFNAPLSGNAPMSVVILQNEFRKILSDLNMKHAELLVREQNEKKRMQKLLSSYKAGKEPENYEEITTSI